VGAAQTSTKGMLAWTFEKEPVSWPNRGIKRMA
jgi:hypothetical protein